MDMISSQYSEAHTEHPHSPLYIQQPRGTNKSTKQLASPILQHDPKENRNDNQEPLDIDTFFAEIKQGNVESVKSMVESNPGYLYCISKTNATPLTIAMKYSKENVVVYLLQAGVDVNERDKNGYTVLAYAVSNKQNELVQILIDHGADVVTPGGPDRSALVLAAKNANISLVKQFLKESGQNKGLAFLYAVQGPSETVVKLLVEQGECAVNIRHKNGEPALVVAASKPGCNNSTLQYLINRGARLNDSTNGPSPLMCMCQNASPEVVQLAVSRGANVNATYKGGFTPLFFAVKGTLPSQAKDICRILVRAGAHINHQNAAGVTPLIYAVQRREVLVIQELLRQGADVFIKDQADRTAVDYAKDHDIIMDIINRQIFGTDEHDSSAAPAPAIVPEEVDHYAAADSFQDFDDHPPVLGAPSVPSSPVRTSGSGARTRSNNEARLPPAAASVVAKINQKVGSVSNMDTSMSLMEEQKASKPIVATSQSAVPSASHSSNKARYEQLLHAFAYFQLWHCEHLMRQAKKLRDLPRVEALQKERVKFLTSYNLPLNWSTLLMARDPRMKPMLLFISSNQDPPTSTSIIFPPSIDWLLREASILWDTLWLNESIDHEEISLLLKTKTLKFDIEEVICAMVR